MTRLGVTEASVTQGRKVTPEKAALACWLLERTTVSLRWISERLALGHASKAGRGPRKLKASDERQRRRAMAKLKRIV